MKSFTKPLLFGVLAVGVSANGYGNDYNPPAVNTPCSTATPVTPQYQTSEVLPPPVYTAPTVVVPPPSYSTPAPPASSAPPEVTCPYTYIASCAYLCKGSNGVAYCSASDVTNAGTYASCTACPGAPAPSTETSVVPPPYTPPPQTEPSSVPPPYTPPPHTEPSPVPPTTLETVPAPSPTPEATCPYTYTVSCAYLCKGGAEHVAYCSDKDVSSDYGKISCSACPGAPVPPPNNGTSTPTYTPPAPSNSTTPYPSPTYNSGATALNIGTAAIFGLICMMFAL